MPPELFAKIDQWAQEVVRYAGQHDQRRTRSSASGMKLRSLPARRGLTEISINPHSRKRRPPAASDGTDEAGAGKKAKMDSEPPKKRGRPPGSKNKTKQANDHDDQICDQFTLPHHSQPSSIPDLPPLNSSAKPSSPSRKCMSPREEVTYTLHGAKPVAAVDMAYLEVCTPAVRLTNLRDLKASKKQIPPAVLSLYDKLSNIPPYAFPSELEVVLSSANAMQLATNDANHS